jgi:hypothetical protein
MEVFLMQICNGGFTLAMHATQGAGKATPGLWTVEVLLLWRLRPPRAPCHAELMLCVTWRADRVMTVSFHKFGDGFFPGTGDIVNVGHGARAARGDILSLGSSYSLVMKHEKKVSFL